MAIYYVKSGGTATADLGRVTTARTGSFATMTAANYYDSIYDVFAGLVPTTPPASGDSIYVSDSHAKVWASQVADLIFGINVNCSIIAVQDLLAENYTNKLDGTGAKETHSAGGSNYTLILFSAAVAINWAGVSIDNLQGDLIYFSVADGRLAGYDCSFLSTDRITGGSRSHSRLNNCTIYKPLIDSGAYLECISCTISHTGTGMDMWSNGDGDAYFYDCDLSAASVQFINFLDTGIGACRIELDRCLVHPTALIYDGFTSGNIQIILNSCHSADGYHFSQYINSRGDQTTETSTVLAGSYDGTNKFATKLVSTANSEYSFPFRVKLATIPAQDLRGDKTYTVEFTCANTLNDDDFWIEVERPDATNQALGVIQSTRAADILTAGAAHTTSTASWTNPLTQTQKDSITVTGMAGVENGTITIWANLAKPSETVVIDTAVIIS